MTELNFQKGFKINIKTFKFVYISYRYSINFINVNIFLMYNSSKFLNMNFFIIKVFSLNSLAAAASNLRSISILVICFKRIITSTNFNLLVFLKYFRLNRQQTLMRLILRLLYYKYLVLKFL